MGSEMGIRGGTTNPAVSYGARECAFERIELYSLCTPGRPSAYPHRKRPARPHTTTPAVSYGARECAFERIKLYSLCTPGRPSA